jgi:hypothetical protein
MFYQGRFAEGGRYDVASETGREFVPHRDDDDGDRDHDCPGCANTRSLGELPALRY